MKKIVTISYAIFLLFYTSDQVFSQLRVGTSAAFAIPTGDFGAINKNGYGASLTGKYQLSDHFALTSNFSYYAFGRAGENLGDLAELFGLNPSTIFLINAIGVDIPVPKTDFFPVNIGFEYYFLTGKIKPYAGFDLGLYFTHTQNTELNLSELVIKYFEQIGEDPPPVSFGSINLTASDANFGMGPVAGCFFGLNDKWSIDLNLKANGVIVPDKKSAAIVVSVNLGAFFEF